MGGVVFEGVGVMVMVCVVLCGVVTEPLVYDTVLDSSSLNRELLLGITLNRKPNNSVKQDLFTILWMLNVIQVGNGEQVKMQR